MDWATQPDPFRRYRRAALIALDEVPVLAAARGPPAGDESTLIAERE